MLYLKYYSFKNVEVNGLTPDDLAFRALYRRGPIGFIGISYMNYKSVLLNGLEVKNVKYNNLGKSFWSDLF